jgi:hypothetical protein
MPIQKLLYFSFFYAFLLYIPVHWHYYYYYKNSFVGRENSKQFLKITSTGELRWTLYVSSTFQLYRTYTLQKRIAVLKEKIGWRWSSLSLNRLLKEPVFFFVEESVYK